MKNKSRFLVVSVTAGVLSLASVAHADPVLYESGINVDGDVSPGGVDDSAFDFITGLGTISVTVSGEGDHTVLGFFDHESDEETNTFFNEIGLVSGTPQDDADGTQTWEIDEPGFGFDYIGDIFFNWENSDATSGSLLDNQIFFDAFTGTSLTDFGRDADDVSMAIGWDFSLAAGDIATIEFLLATTAPTSGFYLQQIDAETEDSVFFSSALSIEGDEPPPPPPPTPVPEPGTLLLLGAGLLGIGASRRRLIKR